MNKERVELHLHTNMSGMDGINTASEYVEEAKKHGMSAIAITDHSVVQAFPEAYKAAQKNDIKLIYGMEGYFVDDTEKGISNISKINECNNVPYYKGKRYHITILVENKIGLKNMYRLVSKSYTEHFWKVPIILKSELIKYREGLIYGSACSEGEIFEAVLEDKSHEELDKISDFYNFLEVQPIENNKHLIETGRVADEDGLRELNKRIVDLGKRNSKMVVASGDVHFLNVDDAECRKILMHNRGFENCDSQPDLRLKTTDEMINEFSYLGEDTAKEIVIRTPNIIADLVDDDIELFPQINNYPKMKDSEEQIRMRSYNCARKQYGENIPHFVEERLNWELERIIENGYADLYMIASEIVKPSHEKGYVVGSRGGIASSIVAYFLNITEINPVAPHYYCEKCGYAELNDSANCGCDLPDKICPECGRELLKDGFNITAETFMGAEGDREPDMDFNFAPEIWDEIVAELKVMFGENHIVRAGTIAQISEKLARRYLEEYCNEKEIVYSSVKENEYIRKLQNVKRTTGIHPGGFYIIPQETEISDYTPIQHPAKNVNMDVVTTHFDNWSLLGSLFKFDILMHDTQSMLHKLEQFTGVNPETIPLNDEKTMKLFSEVRTCGVPEFYTDFVKNMMETTGINSFDDLIRISGLSHGTGAWFGNGECAIEEGVKLSDLISTRDDITSYLCKNGYENKEAFKIAEMVRKGKGLTKEQEEEMYQNGIPEWYIDSCNTVKYLFPRAHTASYILLAYRVAYYKAHYPLEFYCAYFTVNADRFDADLLINNSDELKDRIAEYRESDEYSKQEKRYLMEVCQEMYEAGFDFVSDKINSGKIEGFSIENCKLRPETK